MLEGGARDELEEVLAGSRGGLCCLAKLQRRKKARKEAKKCPDGCCEAMGRPQH